MCLGCGWGEGGGVECVGWLAECRKRWCSGRGTEVKVKEGTRRVKVSLCARSDLVTTQSATTYSSEEGGV